MTSVLYLEKGHLFEGVGFGAPSSSGGEVVFNTGMSGYQEIFTDPSYCGQIVVMSYPHIGNTGVNWQDPESQSLYLKGVVVRECSKISSSWRSEKSLQDYLQAAGIVGISEVDTREITTLIRDEGAQRAVIFQKDTCQGMDIVDYAKAKLNDVPPMEGLELVSQVSCAEPYEFKIEGEPGDSGRTLVVYDFGVKYNILRNFKRRGFRVLIVPYNMPYEDVIKENPVAVVLSNGPGDPAGVCVEEIQKLVGQVPLFAICMGHQLLGRALGANTYKLKFGHHGINHPVKDHMADKIVITSQNHGFAIAADSLKTEDVVISHTSLNDGTVEGFFSDRLRLSGIQFHPEAKPGPNDAVYLFDRFVKGYLK